MHVLSQTCLDTACTDSVICHCLQIGEGTVAEAIAVCGLSNVKEICRATGAGGGCTACHSRLRELLRQSRQAAPVC